MLFAMTSCTPAFSSLYGAVSRLEPQPFEMPLTMTPKPPSLIASFVDLAAAQADQAVTRERLVVVVANPSGRELVGRDVRHERAVRIEREVLAGELLLEQSRVLRDVEDPSLDAS